MMGPSMICVFNLFNSFFLVIGVLFSGLGALLAFLPDILWANVYDAVKDDADGAAYKIPSSAKEFGSFTFFMYLGLAFLGLGGLMILASIMALLSARCSTKACCKKMMLMYAILMIVLIVIELTTGIMLYIKDSPLHNQAKSMFKTLITDAYEQDGTDSFSQSLNVVHRYYDCCGMDNVDDFGAKDHTSCDADDETKGCYSKLQSFFHTDLFPVGLAAFCILQGAAVYCSIILYKNNGGKRRLKTSRKVKPLKAVNLKMKKKAGPKSLKTGNKVKPMVPVNVRDIPGARATTDLY